MGTRAAQWHHGYNPVTHTGGVAPPEEKHKGVKIAPKVAATAGSLQGAACIPSDTSLAPLSPKQAASTGSPKPLIPARVDHLAGVSCLPNSSGGSSSEPSSPSSHSPKSKLLNLRAAVDHMSGPACTVRQVHEVATTEDPLPKVERGMTTKHTKDRMVAQAAKEHMNTSRMYSLGQGYTLVETPKSAASPRQGP